MDLGAASAFQRDQYNQKLSLATAVVFLLFAITVATVSIVLIIYVVDAEHDVNDAVSSIDFTKHVQSKCGGEHVRGVNVGSRTSNASALVVTNTLQQLQLLLPSESATAGRAAYVTETSELFVPDTSSRNVYVYETITWRVKTVLADTTCDGPDYGSYHSGAGEHGQVWFSCTRSDTFIVYDALTYERLKTLKVAASIADAFDPYDVRVGARYAVVSLMNTTGSWSGVLIQYDTNSFYPLRSFVGLGAHSLLYYEGNDYSRLYATSAHVDTVYAFDFDSFRLLYNVTVPSARGVTTDAYERYVYVASATTNASSAVFGFDSSDFSSLSASPYAAPYDGAFSVASDGGSNRLFVTLTQGTQPNTLCVYAINGDSGNLVLMDSLESVAHADKLSRVANGCACKWCYEWSK